MTSLFRKFTWWLQRRRKEDELREELQFHLAEEADERQADGLPEDQARWAARRDLGNVTLLREDTRTLWSWILLEQLAQDLRYGLRTMVKNRVFTALAALSLALGIGANTAIYSFMDAILLRSLPVSDPASLVVLKWRSRRPLRCGERVRAALHRRQYLTRPAGVTAAIFPFPAFERAARSVGAGPLEPVRATSRPGAERAWSAARRSSLRASTSRATSFAGSRVSPAAGRLIVADDDRAGAPPVAVLSMGYSQQRFGDAASATGQPILINNLPFTVIGVTPSEFFGVDPAAAPDVYLPMHASLLLDPDGTQPYLDQNYYWIEMMGRLRPGCQPRAGAGRARGAVRPVGRHDRDERSASAPICQCCASRKAPAVSTACRRQYSKPLYVLLTMVGLILAIACANMANLLLARAAARRREMAVRLSLGAGRWRVVRQLLTESVLLASLSGALGILIAVGGIRVLTLLLANGQERFTLHAELNWHVLGVTLALSLLCGVLFGLAPALQSTRPALMPALKDRSVSEPRRRLRASVPHLSLTQALVVAQIAISLLLLVAAGLFVRTLSNLQSIPLGFNRDNVLLFELNAPQAGYPEARVAEFYADLRRRLSEVPGVRDATLSHASLIRAGRAHPVTVNGQPTREARASCRPGRVLHDHADSDAAWPRDRGRRSPGNAARRRGERALRQSQLRRCGSGGAAHRDRWQHEGRRRAARPRDRRGRG